MEFRVRSNVTPYNSSVVNLRCPVCKHNGTFHGLEGCVDGSWVEVGVVNGKKVGTTFHAGMRRCPNQDCCALVFVVLTSGKLVRSFPPQVLDFDATNLPDTIRATLEEAIRCHATEAYKAAALMVRRLLEELCEDKSAKGSDLKARLSHLGNSMTVPKELLDAADELRILGNDAAHIRAKDYDRIGEKKPLSRLNSPRNC